MKRSIKHLPKRTQQELSILVELITRYVKGCEMIVLYGSYARGGYVLWDERFEFGRHTTFQSDLDILVVVSNPNIGIIERRLRDRITDKYNAKLQEVRNPRPDSKVSYFAPPQFIVEHVNRVNKELEKSQYFFTDIVKEGIKIYDTERYKLEKPRQLSFKEIKDIAVDEYDKLYRDGNDFLDTGYYHLNKHSYTLGSFILHQSCERYYNTIGLVYANYCPKSHDLKMLSSMVKSYSRELSVVFPQNTSFEKHCYDLLCRAYIEARYNREFVIEENELKYMLDRVESLKILTERICLERIASYDLTIKQSEKID